VVAAKAKYANRINGILPTITEERRMYFRDAYHPLYLNNKQNEITHPQTIELDKKTES
jgi:DNA mismatch repair protein MutS2